MASSLARALRNWCDSRDGRRAGPRARFPRFRSRRAGKVSCRFTKGVIRVEPDRHHITLPRLGTIRTHESTRKLARRLEAGTARILSATIRRQGTRWFCSFQVIVAAKARPAHAPRSVFPVAGVDAGWSICWLWPRPTVPRSCEYRHRGRCGRRRDGWRGCSARPPASTARMIRAPVPGGCRHGGGGPPRPGSSGCTPTRPVSAGTCCTRRRPRLPASIRWSWWRR